MEELLLVLFSHGKPWTPTKIWKAFHLIYNQFEFKAVNWAWLDAGEALLKKTKNIHKKHEQILKEKHYIEKLWIIHHNLVT